MKAKQGRSEGSLPQKGEGPTGLDYTLGQL